MNVEASDYRISDGLLVAPFGGTAVAVDLVDDTVHFLSRAGAWLMSQESPVSIDALVADTPTSERADQRAAIVAALDPLRAAGLIDRAPADTPPASATVPVELRGGVVRLRDGRVMVLCGQTGSTLADALVEGGSARLANQPSGDEVLLVHYDPDHRGMLTSRPLEPEAALRAVLDHVTNLAEAGTVGLRAVCHLVESVPVVPFTYPDIETALPVILGV